MSIPINGNRKKLIKVSKMNEKQRYEGSLALINLIMTCEAFVNFNDELRNTDQYRMNIKGLANKLKDEAEKILKQNLGTVWKTDEEIYMNISMNLESYLNLVPKAVANMKPEEFLELNQLILMYLENKPIFRKNFNFTMIEINSSEESE